MLVGYLLLALALSAAAVPGADAAKDDAEGSASTCIGCHDFGESSPVHPLLESVHGDSQRDGTPMAGRGCEACHGPSAAHSRAPIQVAPGVSFGPHWSAAVSGQNAQCLDCHGEDAGGHWSDSHHEQADLACVTCHDIHTAEDNVLSARGQTATCTVCHKAQQAGIHGMPSLVEENPACSSCHSPHDSSSPRAAMLANQSGGCATCHDLVAMAGNPEVSAKATSYHKIMARDDTTCLACHVGIAHQDSAGAMSLVAEARQSREVTLFFPGQSHSEGLRRGHAGLQPLRQGIRCQLCHRGEEASMGATLADDRIDPVTRDIAIAFSRQGNDLFVDISWSGSRADRDVSLMWGDGRNDPFEAAGCFAACHDDMPGMTRDRGQQLGKYLLVSRSQERSVGRPPILLGDTELGRLRAAGDHAELWRITLGESASVATGSLLAGIDWHAESLVTGDASYSEGRWRATLRRPLSSLPGGVDFSPGRKMTLGIALHGTENPGARHWVSLPVTFATDGVNTDFRTN